MIPWDEFKTPQDAYEWGRRNAHDLVAVCLKAFHGRDITKPGLPWVDIPTKWVCGHADEMRKMAHLRCSNVLRLRPKCPCCGRVRR